MSRIIKFLFLFHIILLSNMSIAEVMVPITPAPPTSFATVDGIVKLNSELLTGKEVSVIYPTLPSYSLTAPIAGTGDFNLSVASGLQFQLGSTLTFNTLPDVKFTIGPFPALTQGVTQSVDFSRNSGRLENQVQVIGGKATKISIFANASTTINSVNELYTLNAGSVELPTPTANPVLLIAFPSDVSANISGNIDIVTDNGCIIDRSLPPKTIILNDSAVVGISNPNKISWTVDVSNVACSTGSISGNIQVDGFDSLAYLKNHEISFLGNDTVSGVFPNYGFYSFDSVSEGQYTVDQTSYFHPPYTSLSFAPVYNFSVLGAATYNSSNSVSMTHGLLKLAGDWDFNNVTTANVQASGSLPNSTSRSMSAFDEIDVKNAAATANGEFDFILALGNWQTDSYELILNSNSLLTTREYKETLTISINSGDLINNHNVSLNNITNLAENNMVTASAVIDLSVQQTDGQPPVDIESIRITGKSDLVDPGTGAVYGISSVRIDSKDTAASAFKFTIFGLPGVYKLTAKGTANDGREYLATFDVALGDVIVPPGNNGDDMACFAINKVKIHQHQHKNKFDKSKLHIKYAAFRLPEDAIVDLNRDDVSISVDGQTYDFPAGSFAKKSHKEHYTFKSEKGVNPRVKAFINFDKNKWGIKVSKTDTLFVDINEGLDIDVSLSIAGFVGTENVLLESKNKHQDKFKYKRKPKLSCDLDKKHDDDENDDDHDDDENDDNNDDDDHDDDDKMKKSKD